VKVGDKVKIIEIPAGLKNDKDLQTRSLFERCLGESFVITELVSADGLSHQLVQLDVGHVVGRSPYLETIWVEPEFLEIEESS
jgi:hypothetical protein